VAVISWCLEVGGFTKDELLLRLSRQKVNLNAYAALLFLSDNFVVYSNRHRVTAVGISVEALGFKDGVVYEDIIEAAEFRGLQCCPIALVPCLRLYCLTQPQSLKLTLSHSATLFR